MGLCLLSFLALLADVGMIFLWAGYWPREYTTAPVGPSHARVTSAARESQLHLGDVIDLAALTPRDRYRYSNRPLSDDRILLSIQRGGRNVHVQVKSQPYAKRFQSAGFRSQAALIAALCGQLWLLMFAAVIGWRRSDLVAGRILCALLATLVLFLQLAANNWSTPWLPIDIGAHALSSAIGPFSAALFATYAACFGKPLSRLRRLLTWYSYTIAALAALLGCAAIAVMLWSDGNTGEQLRSTSRALPYLFPLLCAIATISATRGRERTGIIWTTASLGPFYLLFFVRTLIALFDLPSTQLALDAVNLTFFLAPLGLTYSLFGRRLLDFGFVLNRATVIAGVSLLIFAAFSLIEWSLGGWLSTMNRTTNLVISALLALALGLSLRPIHGRVESFVDRVLFRKRHEDERALRAFAHEAAYFTEAAALVRETQRTIELHADVSVVALVLDDGAGQFGAIAENDPAIVALRAWRKPVDLHTIDSQLQGEFAYPMVARGRLVGALVIGPKAGDESLAPDESETIARIAQSVGNALDVLAARPDASSNRISIAIENLSAQVGRALEQLETRRDDANDRLVFAVEQLSIGVETLTGRLDRVSTDAAVTKP